MCGSLWSAFRFFWWAVGDGRLAVGGWRLALCASVSDSGGPVPQPEIVRFCVDQSVTRVNAGGRPSPLQTRPLIETGPFPHRVVPCVSAAADRPPARSHTRATLCANSLLALGPRGAPGSSLRRPPFGCPAPSSFVGGHTVSTPAEGGGTAGGMGRRGMGELGGFTRQNSETPTTHPAPRRVAGPQCLERGGDKQQTTRRRCPGS